MNFTFFTFPLLVQSGWMVSTY